LKSLDHPNVIQLIEIFIDVERSLIFLITELYSGKTLNDLILKVIKFALFRKKYFSNLFNTIREIKFLTIN
jgi:serine/threonine protein kinase